MSSEIITELDSSFSNSQVDAQYPFVEVNPRNVDSLPVVIELLEAGDLPIVYTRDGISYELSKTANTALNLKKLLDVYGFKYVRDENTTIEVKTVSDLMEVFMWTQQQLSS